VEANLAAYSSLAVRAEKKGIVDYVDGQQIIVKESSQKKKSYHLKQLVASNKNILNFSSPLVKKGEGVENGQVIANGNYVQNEDLSWGYIL